MGAAGRSGCPSVPGISRTFLKSVGRFYEAQRSLKCRKIRKVLKIVATCGNSPAEHRFFTNIRNNIQVSAGDAASSVQHSRYNQTLCPKRQVCQDLPDPTCHPILATKAHRFAFQRFAANIAGRLKVSNQLGWCCSMVGHLHAAAFAVPKAVGSPGQRFHKLPVRGLTWGTVFISFLPRS